MLESPVPKEFIKSVALTRHVSETELEVVFPALEGHPTEYIASLVKISAAAVRKRLGEVYKKFEISGRSRGKLAELRRVLTDTYQATQVDHSVDGYSEQRDWGDAPTLDAFYGREKELDTLKQWIDEEHCRLVALVGMGGVGKTALSLKLAEQLQDTFEVVIWRSLLHSPSAHDILDDWLQQLRPQSPLPHGMAAARSASATLTEEETDEKISILLECLHQRRCLLILDNVEPILQSDALTGGYRPGYELYGKIFARIGVGRVDEREHQSCLVLTSREKPKDVATYEGNHLPVRSLSIRGLSWEEAQEILIAKGIAKLPEGQQEGQSSTDQAQKQLIDRYMGNPLALLLVCTIIQDLFEGRIQAFLDQGSLVFSGLRSLLNTQFDRLSVEERRVMYWLVINRGEAVSVAELQRDLLPPTSQPELLEILASLAQRSLISNIGFSLHPDVTEYVIGRLVNQVCDEIASGSVAWTDSITKAQTEGADPTRPVPVFKTHALIKAQAKDYLRIQQTKDILEQILNRLDSIFGSRQGIKDALMPILDELRGQSHLVTGYAGGNGFNLLRRLTNDNLTGYDFSNLVIRQAYLQGMVLHDVDFTNASLVRPVFTEAFGSILSVAIDRSGELLAAGDTKGEIRLWQVSDGEQLSVLRGHDGWVRTLAFNPKSRILVSGGDDHTVMLWDVDKQQSWQILRGHTDEVRTLAISADGLYIASGGSDRTIRLWAVATGACLRVIDHDGWVHCLAFSPDGKMLASGGTNKVVNLWQVATGDLLQTGFAHDGTVRSLSFSHDPAKTVFASSSSDQIIRLWDYTTGECLKKLEGHRGKVWAIQYCPDDQFLVSSSDDSTVRVWNVETGQEIRQLVGHTSRVWSVALSQKGYTIASGSDDQTVRLWDMGTGNCRHVLEGYSSSPRTLAYVDRKLDDRLQQVLVASGGDDQLVRIWQLSPGPTRQVAELSGHSSRVRTVAFDPTGSILASASDDQTIRLWDVEAGQHLKTLQRHTNWVRTLAFHPNPTAKVLASGSDDKTICFWDIDSGKSLDGVLPYRHDQQIWSIAFSPDGNYLASGSLDAVVKLWAWDETTRSCHWLMDLMGHGERIRSVVFSPDSRLLASGSGDRTIRLWDVPSGTLLKTITGLKGRVRSLVFNLDGRFLFCGTEHQAIDIWAVETSKSVGLLEAHSDSLRALVLSTDGKTLISGSKDETIQVWNWETRQSSETIQAKRPYEGMKITGIKGLTETQKATLRALGAVSSP